MRNEKIKVVFAGSKNAIIPNS
jgi:hypothetical protein